MKNLIGIILAINLLSCNSNKETNRSEPENKKDTLLTETQLTDAANSNTLIFHPEHEEDKSYPWYDTRSAGSWINKSYRDKLIEIFKNDTTLSLYEYVASLNHCDGELLNIEIEGCDKDKIFFLKNSGCSDKYIAKSNFELDKKTEFILRNAYSGHVYSFEISEESSELTINGKNFVQNFYQPEIEEALNGIYVIYDHENNLVDTVHYRGGSFEESDTLSGMRLLQLTYVNGDYHRKPTLPHSDLVSVNFYTGDTVEVEAMENSGFFEKVAKTERFQFDLKRTSHGFELYNAYNDLEQELFNPGLVYRFRRIGTFERIQNKRN